MSPRFQRITSCLWFDGQAEEAAAFYTSIFDNAKVLTTTHYDKATAAATGREEGSALVVSFELDGHGFMALNGGPQFKFSEAISLVVNCRTQEEIDHYWGRLSEGGDMQAQQCGWLKDRFGVSWQIVPTILQELLSNSDPAKSQKVMGALMQMKKLDIKALQQAAG